MGSPAYLVKYALNPHGILTLEDCEPTIDPEVYRVRHLGKEWAILRKDIAFSKEEAIEKAEAMRHKRIAYLKKHTARLERLTFNPDDLDDLYEKDEGDEPV